MVRFILFTLMLIVTSPLLGQTNCDSVFLVFGHPQEDPKPNLIELIKNIATNIIYPETAIQDKIEGRVVVTFWIETDGSTSGHKITKSVREDLDKEALRVVKLIKFDEPAKNGGQPVGMCYSLPVLFRLNEKMKPSVKCKFRR